MGEGSRARVGLQEGATPSAAEPAQRRGTEGACESQGKAFQVDGQQVQRPWGGVFTMCHQGTSQPLTPSQLDYTLLHLLHHPKHF